MLTQAVIVASFVAAPGATEPTATAQTQWTLEQLVANTESELDHEELALAPLGERLAILPLGEDRGWRIIVRHQSGHLRTRDVGQLPAEIDAATATVVTIVAGMIAYDPPPPVSPGPRRELATASPVELLPPVRLGQPSSAAPAAAPIATTAAPCVSTPCVVETEDPPLYAQWWFWVTTGTAAAVVVGGVITAMTLVALRSPTSEAGSPLPSSDALWTPGSSAVPAGP